MLKAAILGGSGYTGLELLRILKNHPDAGVKAVTSRQNKGKKISEVFPSLNGFYDDLSFRDPSEFTDIDADLVFSALPHGASMEVVPGLLESGKKVIDLSADYRIKDVDVYEAWYGKHGSRELLTKAVYGLPELHRDPIKGALLVANPGCYPTGSIIALAPVLSKKLVDPESIIIDSKSGVSGAGRGASPDTSYVEVSTGFKAYKVGCHRHTPEIDQELSFLAGAQVNASFTPHLIPVERGILSTIYVKTKKSLATDELAGLYREYYKNEPFVRVMDEGAFPNINQVRCSNYCDIGLYSDEEKKMVIIISAIDNLVKGASGQAVQNMNIMCGFREENGLVYPPIQV